MVTPILSRWQRRIVQGCSLRVQRMSLMRSHKSILQPLNLHFSHPIIAQAVYPSALHEILVKIGAFLPRFLLCV